MASYAPNPNPKPRPPPTPLTPEQQQQLKDDLFKLPVGMWRPCARCKRLVVATVTGTGHTIVLDAETPAGRNVADLPRDGNGDVGPIWVLLRVSCLGDPGRWHAAAADPFKREESRAWIFYGHTC